MDIMDIKVTFSKEQIAKILEEEIRYRLGNTAKAMTISEPSFNHKNINAIPQFENAIPQFENVEFIINIEFA